MPRADGYIGDPEQKKTLLMLVAERASHPDTLVSLELILKQVRTQGGDVSAYLNLNAQDCDGLTALHYVFKAQSSRMVPLYEWNSRHEYVPVYTEISQPDGNHVRVHQEQLVVGLRRDWDLVFNIASYLIAIGADVRNTTNESYTPQLYATEKCCSHNPAENLPARFRGLLLPANAEHNGALPNFVGATQPNDDGGVYESKGGE